MSLLLTLLGAVALAADDDDFDLDDDIDLPAPAPVPVPSPAPAPAPDDGDEQDKEAEDFRETGNEIDLLEGDDSPASTDSEREYRATQDKLGKYEPDEAIAGWEAYLAQHPTTPYRNEIEHRIEELTDAMYEVGTGPALGAGDASKQEFDFAHPIRMVNLNPRTRVQAAVEWGLPEYANLVVDYEHALSRRFSAHVGFGREYSGWNLEVGARAAMVKSLRTKLLLTGILDARFNTDPFFPGLRPQLALGRRFGKTDLAIIGGTDITFPQFNRVTGTTEERVTEPQLNLTAGAMMYYAASERVGAFGELNVYMRQVAPDGAFDGGLYQFDTLYFGLKFFPGTAGVKDKEINFGASVPVAQEYWQFHYGSIVAQLNYYL